MQRNGRCFVSIAQITPDGERTAHEWKRLTCKLRARMVDTSGSSMYNRSDVTVALDLLAFVAFANVANNPRSVRNETLSPDGWLAGCFDVALSYVTIVSIQRAK